MFDSFSLSFILDLNFISLVLVIFNALPYFTQQFKILSRFNSTIVQKYLKTVKYGSALKITRTRKKN
jgi:hypothetical protein